MVLRFLSTKSKGAKGKTMKARYVVGSILVAWMATYVYAVKAETIATQPNQAGGKIVLTDQQCKYDGQVFDKLNRAYNYGSAGYTSEGCWGVEDETVIVYWIDTNQKMRYPITAFTMNSNYSKKKGSSNGYRY
jgi:hypothetical protein